MFSWPQYINSLAFSSPLRQGYTFLEHLGVFFGVHLVSTITMFIFVLEFWSISYSWRKIWLDIILVALFMNMMKTFVPFSLIVHNLVVNISILIVLKSKFPHINSIRFIFSQLIANLLIATGSLILFSVDKIDSNIRLTLTSLLLKSCSELSLVILVIVILIIINYRKKSVNKDSNLNQIILYRINR